MPCPREAASLVLALAAALCACDRQLGHQPKFHPLDPSPFFSDGRSSRPLVAGTIPLDGPDPALATGIKDGRYLAAFPYPVDRAMLLRGRQRFDIYCAVCHDRTGSGDGMVIRRGFRPRPPDFTDPRLMAAPPGLFVDVIANGFGRMYPYEDRVHVRDRWAIAAYIKVLQLAAASRFQDLPGQDRRALEALK